MRRWRRAARARGVSIAALIREAVEREVPDEDQARLDRRRRAFELAGALASGRADTADRHDDVLAERDR